jgi:hypothetical protein
MSFDVAKMLVLMFIVCVGSGCGHRISAITAYTHQSKAKEEFTRDDCVCNHIVATTGSVAGKEIVDDFWSDLDPVLFFLASPLMLPDYEDEPGPNRKGVDKCLKIDGWKPQFQFVNQKGDDVKEFEAAVNSCQVALHDTKLVERLNRDRRLVENLLNDDPDIDATTREAFDQLLRCLAKREWLVVTQPPWYQHGQKVQYPVRFIPRGDWKKIGQARETVVFYNAKTLDRYPENVVRFNMFTASENLSDPGTETKHAEIECNEKKYREPGRKSVEEAEWQSIRQDTPEEVCWNYFCKRNPY